MSIRALKAMAASGGVEEEDYFSHEIDQSYVFSGSQYFHRTPGSVGNRQTFTWSGWVKRGPFSTTEQHALLSAGPSNTSLTMFYINKTYSGQADGALTFWTWDGSTDYGLAVNARMRDTAAWYHVVLAVDTTQATAANRIKIYINNELVSGSVHTDHGTIPEDFNTHINNTQAHYIGRYQTNSQYFEGYLAEVHFIDGTARAPSDFGQAHETTGQWIPKEYTEGSYGTNGFYLKFASGALGTDSSGNGVNYTAVDGDDDKVVLDTPTNNFAVIDPHFPNAGTSPVLAEGNLVFYGPGSRYSTALGTMSIKTGKWYWEYYIGAETNLQLPGIAQGSTPVLSTYPGYDTSNNLKGFSYGAGYVFGATPAGASAGENVSGNTVADTATGDYVGFASDIPNGTLKIYKNGSLEYTVTGIGSTFDWMPAFCAYNANEWGVVNFGQSGKFIGAAGSGGNSDANGIGDFQYSVPSGYLALCSKNLATPTIKVPEEHFNTVKWAGDSNTDRDIAVGFQPDLTWVKNRTSGSKEWNIHDAVRGAGQWWTTHTSGVNEADYSDYFGPFQANGFRVGDVSADTLYNATSNNYCSWNWKGGNAISGTGDFTQGTIASTCSRNVVAGFSIVKYTGTGSNGTVGHGLDGPPEFISIKRRNALENFYAYHHKQSATPEDVFVYMSGTGGTTDINTIWNDTAPTSSVFSIGTHSGVNTSSSETIAYCWKSIEGYSKFGSYEANASTNGPFIYTGFTPNMIMLIYIDGTGESWWVQDWERNSYNASNYALYWNLKAAEGETGVVDFLSNGFKLRATNGGLNNANTYIYMAFADFPLKYANAR